MKKFLDTNDIMFYNNQAPSPSTVKGLNLANLSKTHHPPFHLWICLATRWLDVFGDMEGEEYICNTWMDEVSETAKTIQNTRSAMNV